VDSKYKWSVKISISYQQFI